MAGGVRLMPGDPADTGPPSSAPALGRRLAATGPLYATVESARSPVLLPLEGHESARTRGKAIGGAAVTDDAMLAVALHLRGQKLSLRDIAGRLVVTGKKKASIPRRPKFPARYSDP